MATQFSVRHAWGNGSAVVPIQPSKQAIGFARGPFVARGFGGTLRHPGVRGLTVRSVSRLPASSRICCRGYDGTNRSGLFQCHLPESLLLQPSGCEDSSESEVARFNNDGALAAAEEILEQMALTTSDAIELECPVGTTGPERTGRQFFPRIAE